MNRPDTELAWAAGFFEGEGTVTEHRAKGRLRVAVTQHGQAGPALLERFRNAVGVGNVTGPYDYRGRYEGSVTKTCRWSWQVYSKNAEAAMQRLLPYMTGPKVGRYYEIVGGGDT